MISVGLIYLFFIIYDWQDCIAIQICLALQRRPPIAGGGDVFLDEVAVHMLLNEPSEEADRLRARADAVAEKAAVGGREGDEPPNGRVVVLLDIAAPDNPALAVCEDIEAI